jgi:hypothetical protein
VQSEKRYLLLERNLNGVIPCLTKSVQYWKHCLY